MQYGRYRIVKELGKGNMGVVYQAHDPQIDRMVALKVLRADRVASEDFVARFLKEARAIGRLSHPRIVTVYDVGEDHGSIYIAMEYLKGEPLNEILQKGGLSLEQAVDIVIQVAQALDYAHKEGIVHRDIKPSNIILTPDHKVKLTDFGIARIEDSTAGYQTQAGEILGTPIYMSPEQVTGKKADGRSDLYSLGVLFYEMIVGRRPFTGSNLAAIFHSITHDIPESPAAADPFISRALSDHVMMCLEKLPANRFQTGAQLVEALGQLQTGPPQPVLQATASDRRSNWSMAPLLVGLALVAGLIGGGYFFLTRSGGQAPTAPSQTGPAAPSHAAPTTAKKDVATLKVSSEPVGAAIYVDSVYMGKSPMRFDLPLGKHELRLSLTNYLAWEAQVNIDTPGEMPLHISMRQSE
jgi:serine/threonine protein kinase